VWGWEAKLFDRPAGQAIAIARLLLACLGLLAIWLDPSQPERYPALTYAILAIFIAHAAAMAVAMRWPMGRNNLHLFAHLVDLVIIGLLIYLTAGPTSPFFVLATFALLSGTLHWGARGALITAAAMVVQLLIVTMIDGISEIDRFIMRSGYLVAGAGLFAYYGAYRDRMSARLARLARWPTEDISALDFPTLDHTLAHSADVMQANCVIVVWEIKDEPYLLLSLWSGGKQTYETFPPNAFNELIAPQLTGMAFAIEQNDSHRVVTLDGIKTLDRAAISEEFCRRFHIAGRVACAPFKNADAEGHVFFIESAWFGDDLLLLLEIVSGRVGQQIQYHQLGLRLQEAVIAGERVRLARDLHDSTLQAITAASLRMKRLADTQTNSHVGDELTKIRSQLHDQHSRIRSIVQTLQEANDDFVELRAALEQTLQEIEHVWHCRGEAQVTPESAAVPRRLQQQIDLILMEAAANACRHGKAGTLKVEARLETTENLLTLVIANDGAPMGELVGTLEGDELARQKLGPVSIRGRVAALGGRMSLSSGPAGVSLRLELPLT